VRNISLVMRLQGKPPVLTYKDLRWVSACSQHQLLLISLKCHNFF
jgi:hypothetical protein